MSFQESKPLLASYPFPPRKVALLCASRVGDFICATPAFRALRAALPRSELSLIGLHFVSELVARSQRLDRHIKFPGFPGIADQFFSAPAVLEFISRMQAERFDLVLQMHGSGVFSNTFALLLGGAKTAGFVRPGEVNPLLNSQLVFPANLPAVRRSVALMEFIGAASKGMQTEYPLLKCDHEAAECLLAGCSGELVGLHLDSRDAAKHCPAALAAELARLLLINRPRRLLVILGEKRSNDDESSVWRELNSRPALAGRIVDLRGRTSLPSLGALILRLALLLTTDSAPAHIAYALRVPSVTLFGPTEPDEWGPPAGGPHEVVAAGAMAQIKTADVLAAINRLEGGAGREAYSFRWKRSRACPTTSATETSETSDSSWSQRA